MMNAAEKNQLSLTYAATCKAFDKTLEPDVLRMMVEDLADLDFSKVINALNLYRRDGKNTFWPKASKIRELVNPVQSKDGMANEAASRIRAAITMFGWPNPDKAREYIGELGWAIVVRSGGWSYVCEQHGLELNPLTFHAQARDLAKAMIESKAAGVHDQPIGLPDSQTKEISNVINLIGSKDFPE